jgi:SAM-dependent methyltransferase
VDFTHFDTRKYPTLPVRDGYRDWASTYEDTVCDEMDVRLLERLPELDWSALQHAVDLACGTGRIGRWLRSQGVRSVIGVDCTAEMLERAGSDTYAALHEADVAATGLPDASADLVTMVLADEHLPTLGPVYQEAARLLEQDGMFIIVGYHPHFLMKGIPAHFDRADGKAVAIRSYVHVLSDHVKAAHAAGLSLHAMDEGVVDDAWIARKPKWSRYLREPVSFLMRFEVRS